MLKKIRYWVLFISSYVNWLEVIAHRASGRKVKRVSLRNGLKILGRDSSSLSVVVDEIFLLKRYTPTFLNINKGDVVVDIGAHVGVFSLMAALRGASRVYSFEADINSADMIRKNCRFNGLNNIFVRNLAISNKRGRLKLFLAGEDGGNTLFKNAILARNKRFRMIKSVRLEDIFRMEKIKKIDFLKIDCEGSEGLIIGSTPANVWKRICKISMEYHDNVSPMLHDEMCKRLEANGFVTRRLDQGNGYGYLYAWRSTPPNRSQ